MFLQLSYVDENGKFTTTSQKAVIMAYSPFSFFGSRVEQVTAAVTTCCRCFHLHPDATFRYTIRVCRSRCCGYQPKEPEMQIGLPTDVKHAAHIGWDGPSAADPSWMSGFKSIPEIAKQPSNSLKESKNPAKYLESVSNGTQDKKPRSTTDKPKHKSRSKSSTGGNSVLDSPTKRRSDGSKQSRYSVDSPRGLNKSNLGDDQSTCSDPAGVPKSSRQKKSKGSEGPSKALKSKGGNSLADSDKVRG